MAVATAVKNVCWKDGSRFISYYYCKLRVLMVNARLARFTRSVTVQYHTVYLLYCSSRQTRSQLEVPTSDRQRHPTLTEDNRRKAP